MRNAIATMSSWYRDTLFGSIRNISISFKFLVIITIVISGFLAIGYTFYEMQMNREAAKQLNVETASFSQLVNEIQKNVSDAILKEKEFLLTDKAAHIDKSKSHIANINQLLEEASDLTMDEYSEETIEDLSVSVNNLENFLTELLQEKQKLGLDHQSGIHGELRKFVHDVEQMLKINQRLDLTNSMLMMRRHEKDYMSRKLDKYLDKMDKEQTRFARLLKNSDLPAPTKEVITQGMASYHTAFNQLPALYAVIESRVSDVGGAELMTEMNLRELIKMRDQRVRDIRAQEEMDNARLTRNFYIIGAVVTLVVLVLMVLVSRTITSSMGFASKIADSIAQGKLDNEIAIKSDDEIGQFLRSLHIMQNNLNKSIEIERSNARKNGRIKQALDNVSGSVMIANTDGKIIYMNNSSEQLMKSIEPEIKSKIADFSAENLMGQSVGVFAKLVTNGDCQLGQTDEPCTNDINVGNCWIRLISSPVVDEEGKRMGVVLEWTDRSQEVTTENEIQEIVEASLSGDLSRRIALGNKQGFFALLSQGINDLVEVSERILSDTGSVLESMAIGDLTRSIETDYEGTYNKLKKTM